MNNLQNEEFVFIDRRQNPFVITDKSVIFKWLPFIGDTGFALYSIYIGLTNKDIGCSFPSLNRLSKFLMKDKKTIIKYNRILQNYGLITIDRVQSQNGDYTSNRYYINEVPELPDDLKNKHEEIKITDKPSRQKPQIVYLDDSSGSFPLPQESSPSGGSRLNPPPGGISLQPVVEQCHLNKINIKETNIKKERETFLLAITLLDDSLFSTVPSSTLAKLAQQYSPETVLQAIHSLDYVYRDNRRSIRSPLALLKIALRDGFDPIPEMGNPNEKKQIYPRQSEEELEDFKIKWEEINRKKHLLPPTIKDGWEKLLDLIHAQIGSHVADAWFTPLVPIAFEDDTLLVYAPGQTIIKGLEEKYSTILKKFLIKNALGFKKLQFVNTVDSEAITGIKKK